MSNGTGNNLSMLPFFVRDYIAATRHMSLAERGAYTDLLFTQWETGPLPSDPARLARILGCSAREFDKVWPAVALKFAQSADGLVNERLEEHRHKAQELSAKRAQAGRHGGKQSGEQRRSKSQAIASDLLPAKSNSPSPSFVLIPSESAGGVGAIGTETDSRAELWRVGRAMLVKAGKSPTNAGSLLGRWIAASSEDRVAELIAAATGKADPVAYVEGALRSVRRAESADRRFAVSLPGDPS